MAVESIGTLVPTKIPGLSDAADIQAALRAYHYGSYSFDTAETDAANLINPSIAYTLNSLQTQITSAADDYLDGDIESSIYFNNDDVKNKINQASQDPKLLMYQSEFETYGLDGTPIKPTDKTSWPTTLISDKSRVYKGGSWKDRAYWLAVGTRRFLDEDKSTAAIGFRCAMDRVGSPVGQNYNKKKEKKK